MADSTLLSSARSILAQDRSPRATRLLATLMLITDSQNQVSITADDLRNLMRSSPLTYRNAVDDLQREAILYVTGDGLFEPYTYELRLPAVGASNGNAE